MSLNEISKSFCFYAIQYQPEKNLKLEFSFEDEIINDLYCEKMESEKKDYLTEIYYFKRNKNNIVKVSYGNNQVFQDLNYNFIFNDNKICYSQIQLSLLEKFLIYKKFLEKILTDPKEMLNLLYINCIDLFSNVKMDFVLIIEIIVYLNEIKDERKLITLFTLISQFEIDDIDLLELNQSKEKSFTLLNTFNFDNIDISKINSDNVVKGKIIIMIYLYICLDFPKFKQFYDNNYRKKNSINKIISNNKTIENRFIIENLIDSNENRIKEMLTNCKYFENYLFLYHSYFMKNNKIINLDFKDSLIISNNDNINKIIQYYMDIKSKISHSSMNKEIVKMFNKYCVLFEKNQNINSLNLLDEVIEDTKLYINSLNNCIKNICENLYFSNIELVNFLKPILASNFDKLQGHFYYVDLLKKINIENIDENFIKEYKNLNLKHFFNLTIYYTTQSYFIDYISDLKNMEKVLQIIDFNYSKNIEEEKILIAEVISYFLHKFTNLLETYNNEEFSSLIKILQILISNDENLEDIKKIISILEKKLSQNDVVKIFSEILDKDILKNKEINEFILNYFIEKCLKNNQIDIILKKITNTKYVDLILENNQIKLPKDDEFFIKEESSSLQLLKKFIEGNYLEEKSLKLKKGFINKINSLINEMKDKILNKKFNIKIADDIIKLNEIDKKNLQENINKENVLDSRLKLIFINTNQINYDIKNIKEDLLSFINKAKQIRDNIEKINSYLKEFYKTDQRIEIYSNIKNKLSIKQLNEYKNIMKEAVTYKTLNRISKVIIEFKKSTIFMKIFHSKKEKFRNDNALSEAIATYNEFYEIIKNENISELEKNEELLDLISSSYKNYDDLKECIKKIAILEAKNNEEKGLNTFNSLKEETFEKIYLFHRKSELRDLMRTFEKFSKIFGYNEMFSNQCEELNIYLQRRSLLSGFNNIKKIIFQWDKNLFIKKQNYEVLLFELFQKEQLMNFIKDKNEEDISNLRELIDPSQSQIITQDDIEQLADIIKLKDKLKEKANSENFFVDLSNFIIQTYKNDDGISKEVKKIRNISDKILDIIEIYTKKLDKNVYAENKFESISKNGIFDIIFNQKGYICNVISEKIINKEEEEKKEEEKNNKEKKEIIKKEEENKEIKKEENKNEDNKNEEEDIEKEYKINSNLQIKDSFEEIKQLKELLLLFKKEESNEKTEIKKHVTRIIEDIEKILLKLANIMNRGIDEDRYYHIQINLKREENDEIAKILNEKIEEEEEKEKAKNEKLVDQKLEEENKKEEKIENKKPIIIYENWFIKSKNKIEIKSEKNKPRGVKNLINFLDDIEDKQIKQEIECYENNPSLRLIYGTQFNTVYKYVRKFCAQDNKLKKEKLNKKQYENDTNFEEEIMYLNKFITNNTISKINFTYDFPKDKNIEIDIYKIVKEYINTLTKDINLNDLFKNPEITLLDETRQRTGFYTYPYSSKNPEIDALKCFKVLTNNLPNAQNLLMCNENTSNEEICAFLYRTFLDEKNRLYIIINTDKLNIQKSHYLIEILRNLNEKIKTKMNSLLLFINNKEIDLFDQIKELNGKINLEIPELRKEDKEKKKEIKSDLIEIIYSFKPGVGKSKYIKSSFDKENKYYIYFPVGGDLNLEDLLKRLKFVFRKKNIGLHIDILESGTEEIREVINQFLFSFLFMNYYSYNGSLCFIKENDVKIKVEIPTNLDNNFQKYPILNFFHQKGIFKVSIEKFLVYTKEEVEKQKKKNEEIEKKVVNPKFKRKIVLQYKALEKGRYENFSKNTNPIYIIENEIYVQNEEEKSKIIKEGNYLILTNKITNDTDLIFNYTEIPINLDSNIQIACNYLSLLQNNKLNDMNIFIFDNIKAKALDNELYVDTFVTPEYLNYLKKDFNDNGNISYRKVLLNTNLIDIIPEKECRELLFNYFVKENTSIQETDDNVINNEINLNVENTFLSFDSKKEQYTLDSFYQISSFTNLFCSQLKILSNQKTYYTKNLNTIKDLFSNNQVINKGEFQKTMSKIRPLIIEYLKNNSNICGKSAFHSILKRQNEALEINKNEENKNDNESITENQKAKDIEKLVDEAMSYDKILKTNDLLILNEKDDGLTIISKLANDEYRENLILNDQVKEKNLQSTKEKYHLLNFLNSIHKFQDIDKINENEKDENGFIKIKDYSKLTQEEYIKEIINMVSNIREDDYDFDEQPRYIDELNEDYVFTHDNFIKMIMINMRMNANVPLVIMGETGCGKTSLIKALANLKKAEMIIFNIHAGIDNSKILEFVKENNLLEDENKIFKKDYQKVKSIWVFLDEVNTSNSLGLFSEMMIKRTILGKSIKKNVSFIAACNPYKKTDDKSIIQPGLNPSNILDKKKIKKLAYTVNPLPYSLLNFVFYFGHLEKDDEEKYIENMLEKSLNSLINYDKNIKELNVEQQRGKIFELKNKISKPIIHCQNFIQEKKGVSAVSLRDVNRFVHFFEWFYKMKNEKYLDINVDNLTEEFQNKLNEKNKNSEIKNEETLKIKEQILKIDEYIFSSILGIYVCYFLRLDTNKLRKEMNERMSQDFNIIDFEIFCKHIVRNLVDEIQIKPGIAKNRTLLENLFALFICINNKIPLFLCGKPGYSKSLSLSIIEKAMRGKKSTSEKFKKLPEIARSTYQGSLSSTSEGVLNVFNNTRIKLKNNGIRMEKDVNILKQKVTKLKKEWKKMENNEENKNIIIEKETDIKKTLKDIEELPRIKDYIFMVYFDEMGLAEISPNNPLKVIHSQLEYEKEDEKLAFVGISNWTLDASKMNRGIYLAVSEPDEKDCIETAIEIAKSYNSENIKELEIRYKDYFENLAKSFLFYIKNIVDKDKIDFHGARDFYHLIKLAARNFIKKEKGELNLNNDEIIRNSIQRNFGGYENSVEEFEKIFEKEYKGYHSSSFINISECIRQNILDNESRYLMVISDTTKSQFLIKFFLNSINKDKIFLLGSQFENDLKSEKYTASLLQKIQGAMRNGDIIVMNNLESIYPSLYDLFNQTFIDICKKKYARITIGSSTDSLFEVEDNFKCIILVDSNKLDKQDKPFLNRFEKQVFSFKDLLTGDENLLSKQIYDTLKGVIDSNKSKTSTIDISKHLINFNLEEIRGIVYDNKRKSNEEIKKIILKKLAWTFSQDIMININYSSFHKKSKEEFEQIVEFYNKKPNNFDEFYDRFYVKGDVNDITLHKNIIFTFSKIFEGIKKDDIALRIIDKTDYEKAILDFIEQFFRSEKKKVMVIQMKQSFCNHLNHIQNLIDNYINDNDINLIDSNNPKYITFIIHLNREISKNKKEINTMIMSHLSSYNQIFIDNLKGDNISITRFYDLDNKNLFNNSIKNEESETINFFNKNSEFTKIIYPAFMRFSYKFLNEVPNDLKNLTEKNYYEKATKRLKENEIDFCKLIQDKIIEVICTKEMKNVIIEILSESKYRQKGIDFVSDIKDYMRDLLLKYFIKFIYKSENDGALPSILFNNNKNERLKEYYTNYIKNVAFEKENISMDIRANSVNIIFGLDIPLLYPNLFNMKIFISTLSQNFKKSEIKQRILRIKDDDFDEKYNIISEIQNQFNKKNIFNNVTNIENINKIDMEIFYNNYRTVFIFDNIKGVKNANELFKFIIETKYNNEKLEKYENIGEIILWIETYKYLIVDIITIINDLFEDNIEMFKNEVSKLIDHRKNNNDNDDIDFDMIQSEEPFYSIIDFFSCYVISNKQFFDEKKEFLEYSCELFIQYIEDLFIPSRTIFLLKNCIEIYRLLSENKSKFEEYINEVNSEIENINMKDEEEITNMKNNWKRELEILKEYHNKIDFIISLYILKYRQINNNEYRKFLIKMIIENDNLLPNSQRFFTRVFNSRSEKINMDISNKTKNKDKNKNQFLIFYENEENTRDKEIMFFIDKLVNYKSKLLSDEKRKVLIQIILYIFQSKISITESYLEDYSDIMKYVAKSIDDDQKQSEELDYVIYPNLTRIYCSAFVQIYINEFFKSISIDSQVIGKNTIKNFLNSFYGLKKLWKYIQILMLKILYFNIFNKNLELLSEALENDKFNRYIKDICENLDESEIEAMINNYKLEEEDENYYPLIFLPNIVNIKDIESEFLMSQKETGTEIVDKEKIIENSINYPILSVYMNYYEKISKGKSFQNKLKHIITINNFENSLLNYFNFIERLERNVASSKLLEQEISILSNKIYILDNYNSFKKIWNDEFSNFSYEINNEKIPIKKIESNSIVEDFLMDNKQEQGGRQITEIYKKFINSQNELIIEFVNNLKKHIEKLNNLENNKDLDIQLKIKEINYLLNELDPKYSINIQNATEKEIINLEKIRIETFKNFESLVYGFSKRKCFTNDLTLNYEDYDKFEINYELIEKHLRKCLLYGKRYFNDYLRYINYKSEFSDENFTSNLNELISVFGYEELSKDKKEVINNIVNLPSVLSSLDQLIFYINHNNFKIDDNVIQASNSAKTVANLTKEFLKLIEENDFLIKDLAGLYDYIEEKIFPSIKDNAKNQKYMNDLANGNLSNIIKIDLIKVLENNNFVHKDTLLRALRKFTIKYLLSDDTSIKSDDNLFESLQKEQGIWLYNKENNINAIKQRNNDFETMNNLFINKSAILVKNTILFYEVLNGDDIVNKYKKEDDEDFFLLKL